MYKAPVPALSITVCVESASPYLISSADKVILPVPLGFKLMFALATDDANVTPLLFYKVAKLVELSSAPVAKITPLPGADNVIADA